MSLSSGLIPTEKPKEDILKAYRIRKLGFKRFVEEIIFSHTISFYDPIKQNKLKLFNTMKTGKKEATKPFAVKADEQKFGRLLVIQEKLGFLIKDVLSCKLTIYPLSIGSHDVKGKSNKDVKPNKARSENLISVQDVSCQHSE